MTPHDKHDKEAASTKQAPSDEKLAAMLVASEIDPTVPKLDDDEIVAICKVRGWSVDDAPAFRDVAHAFYAEGCAAQRRALSSPAEAGGKEIIAAPPESYSDEDRAFHKFWYSHMKDELMTGPVRDVSYGSARYIWDAARAIEAKLTDR